MRRAPAHLDHLDGRDHGWAASADQLHTELVPPALDPDPVATVEAGSRTTPAESAET